uniref:Uncharacterized protein n=1 Tax=Sparus aurata TaxID=8175 RepID=A0A671XYM6_SPAAU
MFFFSLLFHRSLSLSLWHSLGFQLSSYKRLFFFFLLHTMLHDDSWLWDRFRFILTPSSTTTPAPMVTLGPMVQFSPICAVGSSHLWMSAMFCWYRCFSTNNSSPKRHES